MLVVRFRTIPINTELRAFDDAVDVYMLDPSRHVMRRWLSRQVSKWNLWYADGWRFTVSRVETFTDIIYLMYIVMWIRRPGFDSRHYQKKKVVGLELGPLSLVRTTEELLDRKVAAPV
jgi:hypothetical protein